MIDASTGTARLLEGGPIAAEIRAAVAEDVVSFAAQQGRPPGLAVVIIGRDAPYYDAAISTQSVDALNRFARDLGILTEEVPYDQVVATGFRHLWNP